MRENPYQAPQTQAGRKSSVSVQFLRLAWLVFGLVVVLPAVHFAVVVFLIWLARNPYRWP